ncbi:MAG: Ig-like domain-containing protein [Paludibacteraceae bacterium]
MFRSIIPFPTEWENASASAIVTVVPTNSTNSVYSNDDTNSAPVGTLMSGNILTNDSHDLAGNTISVTSLKSYDNTGTLQSSSVGTQNVYTNDGTKSAGTLVVGSDGSYTFTPANGFIGTAQIIYTVCDNGSPVACDQATLYLTSLDTSTKYWIGTTDTNWNTGTNWTAGVTPGAGDNVEFATNANNSGHPAVNDMVIPDGATVTVNNLTNARQSSCNFCRNNTNC